MEIIIILLIITVCILFVKILFLKREIRGINRQLSKRLNDGSHQIISIELVDKELNLLASNMNKCFKAEENLRLKTIGEENEFKELIANISHDLRTPLTAIRGYLQLLDNTDMTLAQREKLDIANKYADELGKLIEHFFEYSYLLNVGTQIVKTRINLTNLVMECLAESVPLFEEKNMVVNITGTESVFIMGDKEMLVRIVQNLIRNCIMHSAGDLEVKILKGENNTGELHFINPISEIDNINVDRLFDRFYTNDKARKKSTGLGLSIVKLLTEQLGGSVSASLDENFICITASFSLDNSLKNNG